MIRKKRLIRLTQRLIRIKSENPGGNESRIASFVRGYLGAFGIKSKAYEFKKGRTNIIARLGAKRAKPSLLVTPHLDTVPAGRGWKTDPFEAEIRDKKIYGLGTTDCKGNLACALEALNSIVEDRFALNYNLIFAATADEEAGSDFGLIPLLEKGILSPEAAVVLDSDEFNIIITQKGLIHLKVKIQGRRAHGAYPDRGVNAIDIAVDIIKELRKHKFPGTKNKYLKPPTLNIGTIKGGDKVNIVADWCEFELDIRFLPGMKPGQLIRDIKDIITKHARRFSQSSGFPLKTGRIEIGGIQNPYSIKQSHPLVASLIKAMRQRGVNPVIKGSEGATVITFFQRKNIPAVATGFGSKGCAHTCDEYAEIENLYNGALVLEEFLKGYRQRSKHGGL